MDFNHHKPSPWVRHRPISYEPMVESVQQSNSKRKKFCGAHLNNKHLHKDIKSLALKVSRAVVSLESFTGSAELFQCSGTVIENGNNYSVILISASLVRSSTDNNALADNVKIIVHLPDETSIDGHVEGVDLHFNIAAIRIERSLPVAVLAKLDNVLSLSEGRPFMLRQHGSRSVNIAPGDLVIAIGRFFTKSYDLMAAPGKFCIERCNFHDGFNCKELMRTTCEITRCGIGGPLISCCGEVVGVCFYDNLNAAFLPYNIVSLWWEHYKIHRTSLWPWLGLEANNLYTANSEILWEVTRGVFPNVAESVLVEEVILGDPADRAGIKCKDIIIKIGEIKVQSFLQLFETISHMVGETVKFTVLRAGNDDPMIIELFVHKATADNFYRWPALINVP